VFERAKTVCALDRAATVIGHYKFIVCKNIHQIVTSQRLDHLRGCARVRRFCPEMLNIKSGLCVCVAGVLQCDRADNGELRSLRATLLEWQSHRASE
jgi:hypothetical protein